jgi:hypothetical protein
MSRLSLLGGAYTDASLIAAVQRCINLFVEKVPDETKEGVHAVHLLRPGLRFLAAPPAPAPGRGIFTTTTGDLFAVIGINVYYIDPNFTFTQIGQLQTPALTPVSISDNGQNALVVDGSASGYATNLATRPITAANFTQVGDPNFLGADRVDFIDSFLIMNQPGTPNWYSTLSNQIAFNALDFGAKTASPDPIATIVAVQREAWLIGTRKGEVWYNAGAQGFTFQSVTGVIIEHGTIAKYSIAKQDVKVYWLSQSPEGNRMALSNDGRAAVRISTHAIEFEWKKYTRVDDAIGGCYQTGGHAFYLIHFPTADKTWVYDEATKQWHERNYCDPNGTLHRTREAFYAFAYDTNLALDWANGTLYAIDSSVYTDQITPSFGAPIAWVRSCPHMLADKFERITFNMVTADVEVGTGPGTSDLATTVSPWSSGFGPGFGPVSSIAPPLMSLRSSDDRGASFGNKVMQNLGSAGEYNTTVTWWNLGMARDKIFELSGSSPQQFSLLGVFVEYELHET